MAVSLIFFEPDWPQRLARRVLGLFEALPPIRLRSPQVAVAAPGRGLLVLLAVWFALQLAIPQRQIFFPNLVGWTGDGHRFSWRMRIYDRDAEGVFTVCLARDRRAARDRSPRGDVEPPGPCRADPDRPHP
jgi:vitamin K-dependent gamma-carboxylase